MQKGKQSNLIIFAILTTITIVVWVLAEGYSRFTKTEIKTIPPKILVPLSASLDKETLDTIEKRRAFSKEEVSSFVPVSQDQIVEQPEVTPVPETTPGPDQTATPTPATSATPGTVQPSPSPASQESIPSLPELPVLE